MSNESHMNPETDSKEREDSETLVVLGKNWTQSPREDHPRLSQESKMNALAAGELYRKGNIDRVIFSGGQTAGIENPSEADAMAKYMHHKFPDVPESAVLLEEHSIDTAENAQKILEILGAEGDAKQVTLLSVNDHLPRAEKYFSHVGLDVAPVSSEEVLSRRSKHHQQYVERRAHSLHGLIEAAKEVILRVEQHLDPEGRFLRKITRLLRG